ncbi:unnamed protein product [Nesidiocoris tenuis]|uniref:TOG domain-containing protein n=1 Tax=Nesidiocoris tenuis TaxID=355587 RepID=A0A6H5GNT8_9HEMI|nr:unnamed protein product [Nesidiocoris tenuis]
MPYFPNIMSQLNPYLTSKAEGDDVCLQVEALGNEKLGNVVTGLVMKAAELVVQDDDSDVVLAALEGFQVICKEIGSRLKGWNSIRDLLIKTVKEVLENQKAKEEDDDEEDGSSKATMLGVIAESISGLGPNVQQFIPKLFPYLLKETGNEDPDIRNNALYCIGEMAYHSKEAMIPVTASEAIKVLEAALPTLRGILRKVLSLVRFFDEMWAYLKAKCDRHVTVPKSRRGRLLNI